jgi:dynein heavy chain
VSDHRAAFSKWWVSEWKAVQFPEKGSVYDYYVDPEACLMVPWDERVPKFSYADARGPGGGGGGGGGPLFVPTVETARLSYFLDSLLANRWAAWAGVAGVVESG